MGRKYKSNKRPISNKIRQRMFRQRKKLKSTLLERESFFINSVQIDNIQTQTTTNDNIELNFETKIRDWANMYRISKRSLDDLLAILAASGIDSLPKNHRTLQKTPKNTVIIDVGGGHLWYNGLEKCLKQIFINLDRNIALNLNFNIDGLPLYKSSTINFYPILAAIHGIYIKHTHFSGFL